MERSRLLKRFKAAVTRAKVGQFEPAASRAGKLVTDAQGKVVMRPVLRFHDLRHTFGTQMAASGVPLRTIQEWMGHEDSKTTEIYTDYMPAANEAALIGRAMKGISFSSNFGSILSEAGESEGAGSPVNTG